MVIGHEPLGVVGEVGEVGKVGPAVGSIKPGDRVTVPTHVGVPAILGTVAFVRLRSMLTRSKSPAQTCAALAEEPSAVKLQGTV